MTPSSTTLVRPRPRPRQPRKPLNCEPCRRSKIRCDRQQPCSPCKRRKCVDWCVFGDRQQQPPSLLPSPAPPPGAAATAVAATPSSPTTATSPGVAPYPHSLISSTVPSGKNHNLFQDHWDAVSNRPIAPMPHPTAPDDEPLLPSANISFPFPSAPGVTVKDLLKLLPAHSCCEYLITHYFMYISPLFHILHGPTFQQQYNAYLRNPFQSEFSWLALLFTICSLTIRSLDDEDTVLALSHSSAASVNQISDIYLRYRTAAMTCLSADNCLINNRLSTLEALLLLIYTVNHYEGLERSWNLLGMALHMAIALECNTSYDSPASGLDQIEIDRRRRCWTGILLLYTNQAISYKGVDMSFLLSANASPDSAFTADAQDSDLQAKSVMTFKLRLFQLSRQICRHLSREQPLDGEMLADFDVKIGIEQRLWDSAFLSDGLPSVLDTRQYGYWCILQLYAHQLYLRLHRPFCRSQSDADVAEALRAQSRAKCVAAGAALLDIHQQLCERPRLRRYRWVVYGMTSFYAFHGAVALASCMFENLDPALNHATYRNSFDAAVARIEQLQSRSPICIKSFPILRHLQ
ncbi:hypothetical protein ASPFODRAFT_52815 [Aspergillus luchuensis CBS 106.47]|uniref:Zn(2)-C6 fungal-type domain-containing protein n=1 Tax=Aspergillus luchuensis (strain CBS 106.47) TaxID=1137211 RepID=A0A1M3T1G7_ASPLC|nr:hypothetical protein ASPFODRAFT_52815 [Aspergillus luchuensis CBS 106.47]